MRFYLRKNINMKKMKEQKNFTEFLFLSKKKNVNVTFLRLLNLNVFGISIKRYIKIYLSNIGCGLISKVFNIKEKYNLKLQNVIRQSGLNIELKNLIKNNIKKKISMKLYHGLRHLQKLPVRGQRTKTNAQTNKKK